MRLPLLTVLCLLAAGCQTSGQPEPAARSAVVAIGSVQGPADRSPLVGQRVTVEGVVAMGGELAETAETEDEAESVSGLSEPESEGAETPAAPTEMAFSQRSATMRPAA